MRQQTLGKRRVPFTRLLVDRKIERHASGREVVKEIISVAEYYGHESRVTRLVGDASRFLTVSFKSFQDDHIRAWLEKTIQPDGGIAYDGHKYVSNESCLNVNYILNLMILQIYVLRIYGE